MSFLKDRNNCYDIYFFKFQVVFLEREKQSKIKKIAFQYCSLMLSLISLFKKIGKIKYNKYKEFSFSNIRLALILKPGFLTSCWKMLKKAKREPTV